MIKQFEKLLKLQEKYDNEYIKSEEIILQKIKNEFVNADEILYFISNNSLQAKKFFISDNMPMQFPIMPIRKIDNFYICKHTNSQKPYFHDHDFYELIYVYRGKCTQKFHKQNAECILREKQMCLISPGEIHAIMPCRKNDITLKMFIPKYLFDNIPNKKEIDAQKVRLFNEVSEEVMYCIFKIMQESLEEKENFQMAKELYLSMLFIELFRTKDSSKNNALTEKLYEYLDKNLKQATLRGFAKAVGYNSGYVSRVIKQNTGSTFSDLLGNARLKKAKELLAKTELTIENIAYEIGFENSSGFYKQFCATIGMTPNEYRQMLK